MNAKIKSILAAIICIMLVAFGLWLGYRAGDARGRAAGAAERSALNTQLVEQGRIIRHFEAALNDALAGERRATERLNAAQVAGIGIAETARRIDDRAIRFKVIADGLAEVVRILTGGEQTNP